MYEAMIIRGGNEFNILLNLSREEIESISNARVAEAIIRMRERRVYRQPGYDGVFGKITAFSSEERALWQGGQTALI
jgi:PHP family Zn ribbon phosphoesterase